MNLIVKYIVGLTNLYGQVPVEKVVEIYNLQNEEQLSIEDIKYYLGEDLSQYFVYPHGDYFMHGAIMEFDEFEFMLKKKYDKPYYIPKKETLLKYSGMYYFEKPEQYYNLYEYLKRNIFEGDDKCTETFCEEITLECQCNFRLSDIINIFNAYEINFKDENQANDVLQLIMDLANNTRIWENNGHTPDELFNKFEKQNLKPLPSQPFESGPTNVIDIRTRKKIGRNDPCPCGSGKKYKKCCIDKPFKETPYEDSTYHSNSLLTYEEVDSMGTDEIIKRLKSFGIPFRKDTFLENIREFYSAEDISENWFETYKVTIKGRDEDFPWFAAWVLWERLARKGILPAERISNLIDKGYEYLHEKNLGSACDMWLKAWEAIKYRVKPEAGNLDILDKQYKKYFSIKDLYQDLEMQLHNAGIEDERYFEKRLEYCNGFCECFPNEDGAVILNMRLRVADTYSSLGDYQKAELEFEKLACDYPDNPWVYIWWGDIYIFGKKDAFEKARELYEKARELYEKALVLAKDEIDIMAVEERLEGLAEHLGD